MIACYLLEIVQHKIGFLFVLVSVNYLRDTGCFTAENELAAPFFDWKYVYVLLVELLALQDLLRTLPEGEGGGANEVRVKLDCPCAADLLAAVLIASSRYCF
jgi:hypothetical protein